MRWTRVRETLGMVALLTIVAAPLQAQEAEPEPGHAVDGETLWGEVSGKAERAEANRQMIRALLDRPEVESVAATHGIDLERARDGVATLEGEELRTVTERAQQLQADLAGGDDTIVISTTTLIIALLVLIIILVA